MPLAGAGIRDAGCAVALRRAEGRAGPLRTAHAAVHLRVGVAEAVVEAGEPGLHREREIGSLEQAVDGEQQARALPLYPLPSAADGAVLEPREDVRLLRDGVAELAVKRGYGTIKFRKVLFIADALDRCEPEPTTPS